ncbi:RNA methyltransferase [Candidatus Acidianus copahuensis]|uniref:RNA methyltransferase n=2 Tax=Sulfolobaceae TaxID=118883 RepID=A0A031LLI3_9CREN|nr:MULTISPECIES: RsmB/NOP family class I SAM-dependent RNA methyltransferase [Acidianus]EZQ03062.1 RNA methyltransferase [Candidatus Acidianus copahuensis]NON63422.1 RsmB/NOP family class I SAM-dependent RNA methyltransferase [Acidianus sp. RZ1]
MQSINDYVKKYDRVFVYSPTAQAKLLAKKYGFLDYMVQRYLEIMDNPENFLMSCSYPLKKSIRCNNLKINCNELVNRMNEKGFSLSKIDWLSHGYLVTKLPARPSLGSTLEYMMGYYYIQGIASMIPAYVLNPTARDTVLDMAASPGGKTSQMAGLMENRGVILAVEKKKERIRKLQSNLNRLGVLNTILVRTDVRNIKGTGLSFSKILLDAPCSGEGLIPEDQTRKTKTSIDKLKSFYINQLELIKIAWNLLDDNGTLVYSTCSIAPEENELVVNYALDELNMSVEKVIGFPADPGVTEFMGVELNQDLKFCMRFYPHKQGTEGFFICRLRKN